LNLVRIAPLGAAEAGGIGSDQAARNLTVPSIPEVGAAVVAAVLTMMAQLRARAEHPAVVGAPIGFSVVVTPAVVADVDSEERMAMAVVVPLRYPSNVSRAPIPLHVRRGEDAAGIPQPAMAMVIVPGPVVVWDPAPAFVRDPAESSRGVCPPPIPIGLPGRRDVGTPGRRSLDGHPRAVVFQ
jgi:hypothetical protein